MRIARRNVDLVRPFRFSKKMAKRVLRIAATADLHYGKHSRGVLHEAFAEISRSADVLLLCGDLNTGSPTKQRHLSPIFAPP